MSHALFICMPPLPSQTPRVLKHDLVLCISGLTGHQAGDLTQLAAAIGTCHQPSPPAPQLPRLTCKSEHLAPHRSSGRGQVFPKSHTRHHIHRAAAEHQAAASPHVQQGSLHGKASATCIPAQGCVQALIPATHAPDGVGTASRKTSTTRQCTARLCSVSSTCTHAVHQLQLRTPSPPLVVERITSHRPALSQPVSYKLLHDRRRLLAGKAVIMLQESQVRPFLCSRRLLLRLRLLVTKPSSA